MNMRRPANSLKPIDPSVRKLGMVLVILSVLTLVVLASFQLENWRGRRAWTEYKSRLEARREFLDWRNYLPETPALQSNFYETPLLLRIGTRAPGVGLENFSTLNTWVPEGSWISGELLRLNLPSEARKPLNLTDARVTRAARLLEELESVRPEVEELIRASDAPVSHFDSGTSTEPFNINVPNFVLVRVLNYVLAGRSAAFLAQTNPAAAMVDMKVLSRVIEAMESSPTMVSSMIGNAVTFGGFLGTFWEGWVQRRWRAEDYAAWQKMIAPRQPLDSLGQSLRLERASILSLFSDEEPDAEKFLTVWSDQAGSAKKWFRVAPAGWYLQNKRYAGEVFDLYLDTNFRPGVQRIDPKAFDRSSQEVLRRLESASPYSQLAKAGVPNVVRAVQLSAQIQSYLHMARIVCALELFRLEKESYPQSLQELVPQYLPEQLEDPLSGSAYKYHRITADTFKLYGVGWDQTDEQGERHAPKQQQTPLTGDWPWPTQIKEPEAP
jgi:hypothetical protein